MVVSGLALAVLLPFQNCSDVSFTTAVNEGLNRRNCTDFGTTTEKIKFLFMVDNSGSTNTTDPSKIIRSTSIQDFIDNYGGNDNLTYIFDLFSSSSSYFNGVKFESISSGTSFNFQNSAYLQEALNTFSNTSGGGNTSYNSAFNAIRSAIQGDIAQNTDARYVVIFMSDGNPTDLGSDISLAAVKAQSLVADLVQSVSQANQPSPVTVSTVYFCNNNGQDSYSRCNNDTLNLLKGMAQVGGGNFVNATQAEDIVIDDLVVVPGQVCATDEVQN